MQPIHIAKAGGAVVPAICGVPDAAGQIVIMIHGFESSKACATGQLLFRRMVPAGLGVIAYDQPGHGSAEARREPLTLDACFESLAAVENAAAERWPRARPVYFASSFGAYVALLYVSLRPHLGRRLFVRCGAVNMPTLFLGSAPDPAALALLERQGYLQPNLGIGDPVKVSARMFADFAAHDLFKRFRPGEAAVCMVHGEADPVVPVAAARAFAARFDLPITVFPGENHSLNADPGTPDRVADLALAFFRGEDAPA
ncbi:alpha/beta fold hydrolase [Pseudoramibacter faecis]|uniref:alpha/beta fold hydrolase n=1 Tax=Pseudoramibacter faecis TaxID=3108534 RepID=UPI002E776BD2|nr:alpha/beta fold hydrolase [Pseudoramibacter sp. HA2172]